MPPSPKEKRIVALVVGSSILTLITLFLAFGLLFVINHPEYLQSDTTEELTEAPIDDNRVENGLDVATGFVAEGEYQLVKTTCTACHSSQLVIQNRATREGWEEMIRWMQETQKLWDLGENEDKILDYLAKHYAPEDKGRRPNLVVEEWYEISDADMQ